MSDIRDVNRNLMDLADALRKLAHERERESLIVRFRPLGPCPKPQDNRRPYVSNMSLSRVQRAALLAEIRSNDQTRHKCVSSLTIRMMRMKSYNS